MCAIPSGLRQRAPQVSDRTPGSRRVAPGSGFRLRARPGPPVGIHSTSRLTPAAEAPCPAAVSLWRNPAHLHPCRRLPDPGIHARGASHGPGHRCRVRHRLRDRPPARDRRHVGNRARAQRLTGRADRRPTRARDRGRDRHVALTDEAAVDVWTAGQETPAPAGPGLLHARTPPPPRRPGCAVRASRREGDSRPRRRTTRSSGGARSTPRSSPSHCPPWSNTPPCPPRRRSCRPRPPPMRHTPRSSRCTGRRART